MTRHKWLELYDRIKKCIWDLLDKIETLEKFILLYLKYVDKNKIKNDNIKIIFKIIDQIYRVLYGIYNFCDTRPKILWYEKKYEHLLVELLFKSVYNNVLFKQNNTEWAIDLKTDKTLDKLRNIYLMLYYINWILEYGAYNKPEIKDEKFEFKFPFY